MIISSYITQYQPCQLLGSSQQLQAAWGIKLIYHDQCSLFILSHQEGVCITFLHKTTSAFGCWKVEGREEKKCGKSSNLLKKMLFKTMFTNLQSHTSQGLSAFSCVFSKFIYNVETAMFFLSVIQLKLICLKIIHDLPVKMRAGL